MNQSDLYILIGGSFAIVAIVAWWFIIRPRERSLGTESILQIDANVFLSYRRRDSAYITGRIRKELSAALGDENLFMDTDSIPLGSDFLEEIRAFLEKADVMLVVIGPMWEGRKEDGSTRIHEDKDHVRLEVETALGLNLPIIPIFLEGANAVHKMSLPLSIRELLDRNGVPMRPDPDFATDIQRLLKAIAGLVNS